MIFLNISNIAILFKIYELVGQLVFRFTKIAIVYHVTSIHNFSRAERPSGASSAATINAFFLLFQKFKGAIFIKIHELVVENDVRFAKFLKVNLGNAFQNFKRAQRPLGHQISLKIPYFFTGYLKMNLRFFAISTTNWHILNKMAPLNFFFL